MSGYEIATIILAILTAISSVAWGRLWRKGKKIAKDAREIASEYRSAVEDGKITDKEKARIGDTAVNMLENAADIWQVMENLVREITGVIRSPQGRPRKPGGARKKSS